MTDKILLELKSLISNKATHDQLKYWCKLLGIRPVVKSRTAHITPAELGKLQEMIHLVSSGTTPKDAAAKLGSTSESSGHLLTASPNPILLELADLKKGMLAIAEKMNGLVETNRVILEENRALRENVLTLQKTIEYKATAKEPTPVKGAKSLSVEVLDTASPIREKVVTQIGQKPKVQRQLSMFENFKVLFDDLAGFVLGRG